MGLWSGGLISGGAYERQFTVYAYCAHIEDRYLIHGRAEIRNFSSSVEKYFTSDRSERVKYFQHDKRNFVSPSNHVMFYVWYEHQWNTKPFQLNIFFPAKGAIYRVAITTVIFSHVKITCYFHMWRYHVFARKHRCLYKIFYSSSGRGQVSFILWKKIYIYTVL